MDVERLCKLYTDREALKFELYKIQRQIEGDTVTITPADGWPGKNESERKVSMLKALAADPGIIRKKNYECEVMFELAKVEGEILALETERRAYEWGIREALVQKLGVPIHQAVDRAGDNALDAAAFDDVPF
jgi:hypothetical protein